MNSSINYLKEIFGAYYEITPLKMSVSEYNQSEEFRRSIGFELDDMLLQCNFNWIPCSKSDFNYLYDPIYGNCFTFNNQRIIKQVSSQGPSYGLVLDLFLGNPKVQSDYEINDGVIIVIHNQSTVPFFSSDRIYSATNSETDLKISRNFISKLGMPYNNCIKSGQAFESEYYSYIVSILEMKYTQQHCFSLCLQKIGIDNCNCSLNWLKNYQNSSYCTLDKIGCMTNVVEKYLSKILKDSNCVRSCPFECDTVAYKISTSHATYPSAYLRNKIFEKSIINRTGISLEDIDRSVLRINAYYESLSYTSITEVESLTGLTLFSQIGGIGGFCLGISILSFIEIIDLLFTLIKATKEHYEANRVIEPPVLK